ncbi:MAG: exo-alpha-sialidase [Deltaproteobacteria bacterium]|nr:exo-alpha-sialidase [Deltaproteobacteria bacterium]
MAVYGRHEVLSYRFAGRTCRAVLCTCMVVLSVFLFTHDDIAEAIFFLARDVPTGIYSYSDLFLAHRYMRHIWVTRDGAIAAVVQQAGYEGNPLTLYKSLDHGATWSIEARVSGRSLAVSDGVIDADGNLLLVFSTLDPYPNSNVVFCRFLYDPLTRSWSLDPSTRAAVFRSNVNDLGSRATIAEDSHGVLWCAFRLESVSAGSFQIQVFYSTDQGATWQDTGYLFGTVNDLPEKCAKIIAVGSKTVLIMQDVRGSAGAEERYKMWAWRNDSDPLDASWTYGTITQMTAASGDPYGSHWSVAADDSGNIHLTYEDGGIMYLRYDASTASWEPPYKVAGFGNYQNITVSPLGNLYLFQVGRDRREVLMRGYSRLDNTWSKWRVVSQQKYDGHLRMSVPERYYWNLPMIYTINESGGTVPLQTLLYNLFHVQ